jgi:hypothetical protein
MSAELAVAIAATAFVLMVGIAFGFAALIFVDAIAIWPRSAHRRPVAKSPAVRYYAHPSVLDTEGRCAA